mmetsp:Transcript_473/g.597  ORF Transcript_473/g.597 Transcript_473/m.597 type:complete len:368 (+) Transcript_473:33-1136(+)
MTDSKERKCIHHDSDALVQFVQVEPFYKHALRAPIVKYTSWRECANEEHKYGPPYIENQLLEEAFVEEFSEKRPSLKSIHDCLSSKIDPNIQDKKKSNNRALHYAAKHGNVALMRMLLRAGASVDKCNSFGQTPLQIASSGIKRRHIACVELLLDTGCDVDFKDRGGGTALGQAIRSSNVFTVAALLCFGAKSQWETKPSDVSKHDESCVIALSMAKHQFAQHVGINVSELEVYLAKIKKTGPSLYDRLFKKRICSSPYIIMDMLEKAQTGNLEEVENMRKNNSSIKRYFRSAARDQLPPKVKNVQIGSKLIFKPGPLEETGDAIQSTHSTGSKTNANERKKRIAMKKRIRRQIMSKRNRNISNIKE